MTELVVEGGALVRETRLSEERRKMINKMMIMVKTVETNMVERTWLKELGKIEERAFRRGGDL